MIIRRAFAIAAGALLATVVAGTAAQAAYVASATINGTGFTALSVLECKAVASADTSTDRGATDEVEGYACSSVSVRVFYTTNHGYVGWTNTDSDPRHAVIQLTGTNELQKSYNTATR